MGSGLQFCENLCKGGGLRVPLFVFRVLGLAEEKIRVRFGSVRIGSVGFRKSGSFLTWLNLP